MKKELHFVQTASFLNEVRWVLGYTASQYIDAWENIREKVGVYHITPTIAIIDGSNMKRVIYHGNTIEYRIDLLETPDGWYIRSTRHGKKGCEEMHKSTKKLWEVVHKVLGY